MKEQITSFNYHWYDNGCVPSDSIVHREITISRRRNLLNYYHYNGMKEMVKLGRVKIDKERIEDFFDYLESVCGDWKNDYRIRVCDGFEWKILMWYSSHKATKICGTMEFPSNWEQIEKYIVSFLDGVRDDDILKMFASE